MASNLPANGICIGEHSVCIVRVAKLATDCSPLGGADSGFVTDAIVTLTADPDVQEGRVLEPLLGCGDIGFTYEEKDRVKRYNLTGEFLYHSPELEVILLGGEILVGAASSDFVGDNIGHAEPNFDDTTENPVYLEVITKTAARGIGACSSGGVETPYAKGHIFGKVVATPGQKSFEGDVRNLQFTGKATNNPNLFDGPWNDWPAVGYIRNSPYQNVYYSRAEYDAIADLATCGYATLPAAS